MPLHRQQRADPRAPAALALQAACRRRSAPASAPSSSSALAGPLSSSPSLRSTTKSDEQRDRDDVAVLLEPRAARSAPRVRPSTRGVWLEAASGQMLRHTPGRDEEQQRQRGMTIFHITNSPSSGETISSPATTERADERSDADRPPRADREPRRGSACSSGRRSCPSTPEVRRRPPAGGRPGPGRRRPGCRARAAGRARERLEGLPAQPLSSPSLIAAR